MREGPETRLPTLLWLMPEGSQPCSLSPLLMALLSLQDDDVDPKKQKTDEDD